MTLATYSNMHDDSGSSEISQEKRSQIGVNKREEMSVWVSVVFGQRDA